MACSGVYCRVHGLNSDAGKLLNGTVGTLDANSNTDAERLPVRLDGIAQIKLIKPGNLYLIENADRAPFSFGFGIGRKTLREHRFSAVVCKAGTPEKVVCEYLNGECARSRGNLLALRALLQRPRLPKKLIVVLTDLNVCRILNVSSEAAAKVASAPSGLLNSQLADLAAEVRRMVHARGELMARFAPHRCIPDLHRLDGGGGSGADRVGAVKFGSFLIYPKPCIEDALEVRFVCPPAAGKIDAVAYYEHFLDYGREEALGYARTAVALGDASRLAPLTLATVDPQAFWAAVLRIHAFCELLRDVASDVAEEWAALAEGARTSAVALADDAKSLGACWQPVVEDRWDISTEKAHRDTANRGAIAGVMMAYRAFADERFITVPQRGRLRLHLDPDTKDCEASKAVQAMEVADQLRKERLDAGIPSPSFRACWSQALLRVGLRQIVDPCSVCGACDATENLQRCGRCKAVAFCSKACQVKAWPQHKRVCNEGLGELMRAVDKCEEKGMVAEPRLFDPTVDWRGVPQVISDAAAFGTLAVNYQPSAKGAKSKKRSALLLHWFGKGSTDGRKEEVRFDQLTDLAEEEQFMLACGPLPDLTRAKELLPRVLEKLSDSSAPQSDLAPSRFIAKLFMAPIQLSALEWAAKKGNRAIVEWLCTDERTRTLLTFGAPVGWACYTGRVEVARVLVAHGASATATTAALWGHCPPILAAASNGQLEAMQWLVSELGHDVRTVDHRAKGVAGYVKQDPGWRDGPKAALLQWAQSQIAEATGPPPPTPPTPSADVPLGDATYWRAARGIKGGLPSLCQPAEPTTGLTPFMRTSLHRCAACGKAPPANGATLQACSGCRLLRYCSVACQRLAFDRAHKKTCGAGFPSQREIDSMAPSCTVEVLREFGAAHVHLAATAVERLQKLAAPRMRSLAASRDGAPVPKEGLAPVHEMIDAGATEAVLWAMRAPFDATVPNHRQNHMALLTHCGFVLLQLPQLTFDVRRCETVYAQFDTCGGTAALSRAIELYPNNPGLAQACSMALEAYGAEG
jgi:hypothetical protein